MRLLMTTDTVGGVWTFTSELSGDLLGRGHSIAMVSFGRLPSAEQFGWVTTLRAKFPKDFDFTSSTVPLEWSQENAAAGIEGAAVLCQIAEAWHPDLLLSSQFCFGAADLKVPRVVVAHSDVLSWARTCKLAALSPSPWLHQYKLLLQNGLAQAEAVVAPTAAALQELSINFGLPRGGTVIANGRDVAETTDHTERRLQAVSAGRLWDEAKGLDLLRGCELPLPVLIAGETEFEGESLPPMPTAVRLLGPLAEEPLHQLFRQSAMYLCTSRYEPFGLAPLEAALCGCAIVARDLPSLREVWGDDALYFRDAAGLVKQVERLTANPSTLHAMQERAQRRAATFTVRRMTDGYLALFARLGANAAGEHAA